MIDGNLALKIIPESKPTIINMPDIEWTFEQHADSSVVSSLYCGRMLPYLHRLHGL